MAEMSAPEREFVERLGMFLEGIGGTRVSGMLLGWLLVCDPPHQSLDDLAETLGISKASASTMLRGLERSRYVERVPVPGSRRHHYRVTGGGTWIEVARAQWSFVTAGNEVAQQGLRLVDDQPAADRRRMQDFADLFGFFTEEYGDEQLLRRWEAYRERRRRERGEE